MEREQSTQVPSASAPPRVSAPTLDRQELGAVFAGGFLGALARSVLAQALTVHAGEWPWATFAVNMLGALLLGYFVTRLGERLPPSLYGRAFLASGICGALTTFSTMMLELLRMIEGGYPALAAGYGAATIAGGLAAVFLATKLVRRARVLW